MTNAKTLGAGRVASLQSLMRPDNAKVALERTGALSRFLPKGTISLAALYGINSPSILTKIAAEVERERPKRAEEHFGILRGAEDMATLIELQGKARTSKEARKRLEKFLEDLAKKALTRLKVWCGLKRGRPRDISKWDVWVIAAMLREKDPQQHSWRKLTRKLDPNGYAEDPHGATDRMRHGVLAVQKEMAEKHGESS